MYHHKGFIKKGKKNFVEILIACDRKQRLIYKHRWRINRFFRRWVLFVVPVFTRPIFIKRERKTEWNIQFMRTSLFMHLLGFFSLIFPLTLGKVYAKEPHDFGTRLYGPTNLIDCFTFFKTLFQVTLTRKYGLKTKEHKKILIISFWCQFNWQNFSKNSEKFVCYSSTNFQLNCAPQVNVYQIFKWTLPKLRFKLANLAAYAEKVRKNFMIEALLSRKIQWVRAMRKKMMGAEISLFSDILSQVCKKIAWVEQ